MTIGGDGEPSSISGLRPLAVADEPLVLGARLVRAAALFYPQAPRSLGARRGPRPWATPRGEAATLLESGDERLASTQALRHSVLKCYVSVLT